MSERKHIRVRVIPGADADAVKREEDGGYTVSTRSPAEGGKANKRVCEMIQNEIGKPVRIVSGHKSPKKILEIVHT